MRNGRCSMGRFTRSWRLMFQSYGILMHDKELLLLPVMSAITILLVCASFVVPVLVLEDQSMAASFRRSLEMVKKTWGEAIIGSGGIGLVALLYWLPLIALVALLVIAHLIVPAIVVAVAGGTAGVAFF